MTVPLRQDARQAAVAILKHDDHMSSRPRWRTTHRRGSWRGDLMGSAGEPSTRSACRRRGLRRCQRAAEGCLVPGGGIPGVHKTQAHKTSSCSHGAVYLESMYRTSINRNYPKNKTFLGARVQGCRRVSAESLFDVPDWCGTGQIHSTPTLSGTSSLDCSALTSVR